MGRRRCFRPGELVAAFHVPDVEMVRHKSAMGALLWMFTLDLARPFRVAALAPPRARILAACLSLGGTSAEQQRRARTAFSCAAGRRALSKRMVFLSRTQQVFQLWHVVHRPFSYAFVVLAILHIATAMLLGYL